MFFFPMKDLLFLSLSWSKKGFTCSSHRPSFNWVSFQWRSSRVCNVVAIKEIIYFSKSSSFNWWGPRKGMSSAVALHSIVVIFLVFLLKRYFVPWPWKARTTRHERPVTAQFRSWSCPEEGHLAGVFAFATSMIVGSEGHRVQIRLRGLPS